MNAMLASYALFFHLIFAESIWTFSAESLEYDANGQWSASECVLENNESHFKSLKARFLNAEHCPKGEWSLEQPSLKLDQITIHAKEASYCIQSEKLQLREIEFKNLSMSFLANQAQLQSHSSLKRPQWQLNQVQYSRCQCQSQYWKLKAESSEYDSESNELLLKWPAFYLMDVPVFILPYWHLTLDRTWEVRFPRMGYDSGLGFWGELPFFIPITSAHDLILSPGWMKGPSLSTELKDIEKEQSIFGKMASQERAVSGHFYLGSSPLSLSFTGGFANDQKAWKHQNRLLNEQLRNETHSNTVLYWQPLSNVAIINRFNSWQNLSEDSWLLQDQLQIWSHNQWGPLFTDESGAIRLKLDEANEQSMEGNFAFHNQSSHWLGPIHLQPEGFAHAIVSDDYQIRLLGDLNTEMAIARAITSQLTHRMSLQWHSIFYRSFGTDDDSQSKVHLGQNLIHQQVLSWPDSSMDLRIGLHDVLNQMDPFGVLRLQTFYLSLSGDLSSALKRIEGQTNPFSFLTLSSSLARIDQSVLLYTYQPDLHFLSAHQTFDEPFTHTLIDAAAEVRINPWRFKYRQLLLNGEEWGFEGEVLFQSCGCLTIKLSGLFFQNESSVWFNLSLF